jgi:predicted DNA binding CopG/RHH family protein
MGEKAMKHPKFKTEAEEAGWLAENRERVGENFAKAMREGKTTRLTREKLAKRIEASRVSSKAINIRIAEGDLQLARELAQKKGLPYQTYLKSLLHEALWKAAHQ